jgi:hypothetical protein
MVYALTCCRWLALAVYILGPSSVHQHAVTSPLSLIFFLLLLQMADFGFVKKVLPGQRTSTLSWSTLSLTCYMSYVVTCCRWLILAL